VAHGLHLGLALILSGLLALVAGCTHVQPYEREDLGALQEHEDAQSSGSEYDAHFWAVREGASGGTGRVGGGCGCN